MRWSRRLPLSRIPLSSFVLFLAAVGVTFSSMGFLGDIGALERQPFSTALYAAAVSGIGAMAFATAFTRNFFWLIPAIAIQVAGGWFLSGPAREAPWAGFVGLDTSQRLHYDRLGAMIAVFLGYNGFLAFIGREGRRWFAVRAEMDLAQEMHHTLVPAIDRTIAGTAFHGISQPSGRVGGDLVDLIDLPNGDWLAYVADVSGHGVSSGLIMGMVKSAMRMGAADASSLVGLVSDLNRLMCSQISPNMFVTLAAIRGHGTGCVETVTAGHPPVLRVRAASGKVDEGISGEHVPVGVTPEWTFSPATLTFEGGDVLVLVTDGLFEVFDKADRQLGLDGIKQVLSESVGLPLTDMADRVFQRARAFGPQLDDQTILLLRR